MNCQGDFEFHVIQIISILKKETKKYVAPAIDQIVVEYGREPFLILISCLLSLRTRDVTSLEVSKRLFQVAKTPKQLLSIPLPELEKILYSVGFYKRKAGIIQSVSKELLEKFSGRVPQTEQELLSIKGIGQKTANAVLGYAFDIPALCVDTHVHQLVNRLGWVKTKTPEQTEKALKEIVPKHYWIELNYLLVTWGQNICTPVRPFCSQCAIAHLCPKIGVTKSR